MSKTYVRKEKGTFSSFLKTYGKKVDATEQSAFGAFDKFSFNSGNDRPRMEDILKSKTGLGLVSMNKKPNANAHLNKKPAAAGIMDKNYNAAESDKILRKNGVMTFVDDKEIGQDGQVKKEEEKKNKKKKKSKNAFENLGLVPELTRAIEKMNFKTPTPIQNKAIPILLEGKDVVAMARTGSGKTVAFALPLLQNLIEQDKINAANMYYIPNSLRAIRAVVLSPTRELARQTFHVVCQLCRFTGLRAVMLVGGQSLDQQFEFLSQHPDILVVTPGRLVHHLVESSLSLSEVKFCCFDEADRLFEMGFAQQLYEILRRMNEDRQTCLFSATIPKALVEFTRAGLKDPVRVSIDSESKLSPDLQVSFALVRTQDKLGALLYLLEQGIPETQQAIVFVSTKYHVDYIERLLNISNIPSVGVYGDLDAEARVANIRKFKDKVIRVLVVTDVAARGIDIPLLDNVINFDMPSKAKLFIHRAGRVARAGSSGLAYTLVTPEEMPYLFDLYLFFAWNMPLLDHLGEDQLNRLISKKDRIRIREEEEEKKRVADDQEKKQSSMNDDDDDDEKLVVITQGKTKTTEMDGLIIEEMDAEMDEEGNVLEKKDQPEELDEASKNEEEMISRVVEIGRFPAAMMDPENERLRNVLKQNIELLKLEWSVNMAFRKYCKTRETASTAATKRWKEAKQAPLHPIIVNSGYISDGIKNGDIVELDNALTQIANFTPKQTIFELKHDDKDGTMLMKRREHDVIINKKIYLAKQKEYNENDDITDLGNEDDDTDGIPINKHLTLPQLMALANQKKNAVSDNAKPAKLSAAARKQKKKFDSMIKSGEIDKSEAENMLDETLEITKKRKLDQMNEKKANYISMVPNASAMETAGLSINARLDDYSLDLTAEDDAGMRKSQKTKRWDVRRKKYITSYEKKDAFGKNVLNESGVKVKGDGNNKGQLYENWLRKNKKHHAMHQDGGDGIVKDMSKVARGNINGKKSTSKGSSGIKTAEEVRKGRETREVNKVRHASKKPAFKGTTRANSRK